MKNTIGFVLGKVSAIFCVLIITVSLLVNVAMASNDKGNGGANDNGNVYGQEKKEERAQIPDNPDNNPSKHPSGNDRNEEKGKSGTQGKSQSNPDGDGADKRQNSKDGAFAGTQGDGDYDNNNGCGNDNDFADDNNGNCGGKEKPKSSPTPKPSPNPEIPKKETICHATGSETNPYVEITISDKGILDGHMKHEKDIIPVSKDGCPGGNIGGPSDPSDPQTDATSTTDDKDTSSSLGSITSSVLGTISELPKTGLDILMYAWILSLLPIGAKMALYKRKEAIVTQVLGDQS